MKQQITHGLTTALVLLGLVSAAQDTARVRRNEFGANIAPVALIMMGGSISQQIPGLAYKRLISERFALRLFAGSPVRERFSWFDDQAYWHITDTVHQHHFRNHSGIHGLLRAGLEYRKPFHRNWVFVAAFDLQALYSDITHTLYRSDYRVDSITGTGTAEPTYWITHQRDQVLKETVERQWRFGGGLSAGLLIPIGQRFWIVPECRGDLFIGPYRTTVKDRVSGQTRTSETQNMSLNIGPPIGELHLFYRF